MRLADFGKSWETLHGMVAGFFSLLPKLVIGLIVFAIFWIVGSVVRSFVRRATEHHRHGRNLALVLGRLANILIILFGTLVAISVVSPSFHAADLIRVLGVGSIAIGFAFRDILQNFLAGILLLINEPFRLGDQIRVGDFEGTVEAIETRATSLKTYDGRRVVIPNADLYTKAVTVNTAYGTIRTEYDVGIGYGDDIATACNLILEAVKSVSAVLEDPPPEAFTVALGESSVNIRARWWTRPAEKKHVLHTSGEVLTAIKNRLTAAGIDLPYPTRQILFHDQTEETDGDRRRQREGWPAKNGEAPAPRRNDAALARSNR